MLILTLGFSKETLLFRIRCVLESGRAKEYVLEEESVGVEVLRRIVDKDQK